MTFVRLKHRANRGPPEAGPLDFDNFGDVTGKLIFGSGVFRNNSYKRKAFDYRIRGANVRQSRFGGVATDTGSAKTNQSNPREIEQEEGKKKKGGRKTRKRQSSEKEDRIAEAVEEDSL